MRKLEMDELNRVDVEGFKSQEKFPIVVVLDNIRSMNNVGSAFRTSDSFNVKKVVLAGITATPPHREIHKTALGATESVDWQHYPTIEEALEALKQEGYKIAVVEQIDKSMPLQEFSAGKEEKYAFVFGNEAFGVSEEALPWADVALEIPQFGTKHSLNVSVTMGIVLWDYVSKQIG